MNCYSELSGDGSASTVQDITTILNLFVVVDLTSECSVAGTVAGIED